MRQPTSHFALTISIAVALGVLLCSCFNVHASDDPAGIEFFERTVRPILVDRCVSCHGSEKAKGGLRLDSRESSLKGGNAGSVVTPGKPKESRLVTAIHHTDETLKMPPKERLPDREIAALEKWVELGVPWPDKVVLAATGAIAKAAASHWAFQPITRPAAPPIGQNPIDAIILANLETKGLKPNPLADRRTLIRRATFDLHGLPPTPEEIEAFVSDSDPNAYVNLIDRLLASPRYGERWARHWLDVARYADNKGYVFFEGKEYPWAWTYRDYVIAAFNADKPYDRFVTEQLAADLFCPEDAKAQAALGFLTVGGHFMNNTHDILDDRIDVVTRGLLGLTVTCARCHDHKFDPIPSADYYSLYGVFRSCIEPNVPPLVDPSPSTGEFLLYDAELKIREKKLLKFVTDKHTALVTGARTRAAEYLLAAYAARNQPPADEFMLLSDPGDLNPSMIARWRQFLVDTRRRKDPAWLCWHAVAELPEAEFAENAAKSLAGIAGNRIVREAFAKPPESMKDVASRYGKLLADIDRQWKVASENGAKRLDDADAEALRRVLYGPDSPADAPLALDWGFSSLFTERAAQAEYEKLQRELEKWLAKGPPRAMVLYEADRPYDARVFERGNPGRPGEAVPRQFLRIANSVRKPFGEGSGRLDLAREIVAKTNPLTARVFVNRVWMHHFGKPLVGTPGDFGLRGDLPTHPELLDWLSAEFMTDWSIKRLHRLIMSSAAYRQSSLDRPDGLAADPEDRWLWKQNRRRLEFEPLHDSLLAVSGQLDLTSGGPPIRLFGGNRRRAIYGYVDRLEFSSLLTTFDVPNPAGSNPERTRTMVSPQALFLMNGSFSRDAAKKLVALHTIQKRTDPGERLEWMYLLVYGRKPSNDERKLALAFAARGKDTWVDLAQGLMMTNEFYFVD